MIRRRGSVTVLAYHAVGNLPADPVLAPYAVTVEEFTTHLDTLERLRYRFIDLDELLSVVRGTSPPPARGVLLSFDDGYADLRTNVAPVLRRRRIPAVAFAVAGALGTTNVWDVSRGAAEVGLLDAAELAAITRSGIEVGSHSHSHADLTRCSSSKLAAEVAGSRANLAMAGSSPPRAFSYPYGAVDATVAAAVRDAGYEVGFTMAHGVVRGAADPFLLPRLEVRRGVGASKLRLKLAVARAPFGPGARRVVAATARALR